MVCQSCGGVCSEFDPRCPRCLAPLPERTVPEASPSQEPISEAATAPTASARSALALAPGEALGRFVVLDLLGQGSMGVVLLAHDPALDRKVALKVLRGDLWGLEDQRRGWARLRREAQAMARMSHPNVIAIYDVGLVEDDVFIAMEYVDGGTLRSWLEAERRPQREILARFFAAGRGLAAAHDAGLAHRDFKPENVLIGSDGRVRVTDFGLVGVTAGAGKDGDEPPALPELTGSEALTRTSALVGTPIYMAPEQHERRRADARADQFAFCVALYEALHGERPFAGDTYGELRSNVLAGRVRKPPRGASVPARVRRVLLRGLRVDREERYPSMKDLLDDLAREPRAALRRAGAVLGVAIGAAALIGVARRSGEVQAYTGGEGRLAGARRPIAVLGFKNLSGREEVAWIGTALGETMTFELAMSEKLRALAAEDVVRAKRDLTIGDADGFGPGALGRVGRRLGAEIVVTGAYLAAHGKLRLDVRLLDARTGEALVSVSESGSESEMIDLCARAGAALRRGLHLEEPSPAEVSGVRASQPSSPEAAQAYAEGLAKLRAFDGIGAEASFERTIALDPRFALGHAALAEARVMTGRSERAALAARRATELAEGLRREERLSIEARHHEALEAWPKAIEAWQALHVFFPDDLDYGLRLVGAQIRGDRAKDALATVEALRRLPPPIRDDPRLDLAEAGVHFAMGDYVVAARSAEAARAKAEAIGATSIALQARIPLGWSLISAGEIDRGIGVLDAAKQGAQRSGDPLLAVEATSALGSAHAYLDDLGASVEQHLENARALRAMGNSVNAANEQLNAATALVVLGRLTEAQRNAEPAADAAGPWLRAQGRLILARIAALRGDPRASRPAFAASIQGLREAHDARLTAWGQALFAELAIDEDRLEEAEALAREALATRERLGLTLFTGESRAVLARVLLARGALGEAEALARSAREVLAAERAKSQEAAASALLARILVERGRGAEAAAPLARARELAARCQSPAARIEVSLAGALADARDAAAARQALEASIGEATRIGHAALALEARLALARLDVAAGRATEGRAAIAAVSRAAEERGLARLARMAREAR